MSVEKAREAVARASYETTSMGPWDDLHPVDKSASLVIAQTAIDAFLASLKEQAGVVHATVRDGGEEWHIECRMADGQKGAFINVDKEFEALADVIAGLFAKGAEDVPHI